MTCAWAGERYAAEAVVAKPTPAGLEAFKVVADGPALPRGALKSLIFVFTPPDEMPDGVHPSTGNAAKIAGRPFGPDVSRRILFEQGYRARVDGFFDFWITSSVAVHGRNLSETALCSWDDNSKKTASCQIECDGGSYNIAFQSKRVATIAVDRQGFRFAGGEDCGGVYGYVLRSVKASATLTLLIEQDHK